MISIEQTSKIAASINASKLDETVLSKLRQDYPDIHFTYCMEDDIPNNAPVYEAENFNLYYIDGREHCLCLTNDSQNATGIVVAEIIDE